MSSKYVAGRRNGDELESFWDLLEELLRLPFSVAHSPLPISAGVQPIAVRRPGGSGAGDARRCQSRRRGSARNRLWVPLLACPAVELPSRAASITLLRPTSDVGARPAVAPKFRADASAISSAPTALV